MTQPQDRRPTAASASRIHLDFLDGVRALAALVVVLNHAYAEIWPPYYHRFPPAPLFPLTYLLVVGHLAVNVFIVLSGFCLMLPVVRGDGTLRGGARPFFLRRARRILPPYYAALALSLLLIRLVIGHPTGTHWDFNIRFSPRDVIAHLLLLQDVFGTGKINYVFWSIAVEWQIYFLFPWLVWLWGRVGAARTTFAALCVGVGLLLLAGPTRLARANPHFLALFVLGMLAAQIAYGAQGRWQCLRDRFPWRLAAVGTLAAVGFLCHRWGWLRSTRRFPELDLPVGLFALSLLVSVARPGPNRLRSLLSCKLLAGIGAFSYSLYLIHAPLLQLVWQVLLRPLHLGPTATFGLLVCVGVPLILGAAYLFSLGCERPFLTARPPAQPPAPASDPFRE